MTPLHVVLVSGGKDSAAVAALAVRRVPLDRILFVFADTGNEHPETYAYLDRLEAHFGKRIERVRADFTEEFAIRRANIAADQRTGRFKSGTKKRWSNKRKRQALDVLHPTGNPFLDLCLLNGTFPSNTSRFCTRRLKIEPMNDYLDTLHAENPMIVWQGVKRADSQERAHYMRFERFAPRWYLFRPILDWTHEQVFDFLRETSTPVNPLYGSGFSRVSCGPCFYARKGEMTLLADQYPEAIDRIRMWESMVSKSSKTGWAGFFAQREIPGGPETHRERRSIDGAIRWARVDFRKNKKARIEDIFPADTCSAGQGMCE